MAAPGTEWKVTAKVEVTSIQLSDCGLRHRKRVLDDEEFRRVLMDLHASKVYRLARKNDQD